MSIALRWSESVVKYRKARHTGMDFAVVVNDAYIGEMKRTSISKYVAWEVYAPQSDGTLRYVAIKYNRKDAAYELFKDAWQQRKKSP
jgi:hypothetical protein